MSETQILCSYNGDNKMNPAEGLRIHYPCTRAKETCPGLNFRGLWNLQNQMNVPTQDFPRSYTLNCTQDRNPGCAMIPALDPPSQRWTTQTASPLPQEGESSNSWLQGRCGECLGSGLGGALVAPRWNWGWEEEEGQHGWGLKLLIVPL